MLRKIEISDNETEELIEFYEAKLSVVRSEKEKVLQEEKRIEMRIRQLSETPLQEVSAVRPSEPLANGYDRSWQILPKIKFVLKESGRKMATREIVNRLLELDAEKTLEEKRTFGKSVSTALSIHQGENKTFGRGTNENNEYIFWLN